MGARTHFMGARTHFMGARTHLWGRAPIFGGAHPFLKDAPLLLSHSLSCAPVEEATEDSQTV